MSLRPSRLTVRAKKGDSDNEGKEGKKKKEKEGATATAARKAVLSKFDPSKRCGR